MLSLVLFLLCADALQPRAWFDPDWDPTDSALRLPSEHSLPWPIWQPMPWAPPVNSDPLSTPVRFYDLRLSACMTSPTTDLPSTAPEVHTADYFSGDNKPPEPDPTIDSTPYSTPAPDSQEPATRDLLSVMRALPAPSGHAQASTINDFASLDSLPGLYSSLPAGATTGAFDSETLLIEPTNTISTPSFIDALSPDGPRVLSSKSKLTKTESGWVLGYCREMDPAHREQLDTLLLDRFKPICATGFRDLGCYDGSAGPIRIEVKDPDRRVYAKPRRHSQFETEIMHQKVPPLIDAGIIVRSLGTKYASNNVIATKKDADGNYTDTRFCHNYRPINQEIASDNYCLPRADQLHLEVADSRIFSKIDARSGFLQIPIHPDDQDKTSFWYNNELWKYTRMPFGMKNSPAEFQRRMDAAIQEAGISHFCRVYIDDLLIHSSSMAEHLTHLAQVFDMLAANGIKAHPDKSIFAAEIIEFLGHDVSHYGLTPSEAKVLAIRNLPEPHNVPDLRRVLGFMGYYRGYVPNYSAISLPLTQLTCKDAPWQWRPGVEAAAYQLLKDALCNPDCALKRADLSKPFLLHTDFCNHGLGAVLGQIDEHGQERIVACVSRSLNKYEKNYASYKGEMLAAVWAVRSFDYYLRGAQFTLVTDHSPLVFLMTNNDLQGQYARWALILQEYNFTTVHRPGAKHQNADTLSRYPLPSSDDSTGARMDVVANTSTAASPEPMDGLTAVGLMSSYMSLYPAAPSTMVETSLPSGAFALSSSASLNANVWADLHLSACAAFTVAPDIDSYAETPDFHLEGGPDDWADCDTLYADFLGASNPSALSTSASLSAPAYQPLRTTGGPDGYAVCRVRGLDTRPLPRSTVTNLPTAGVTLYEPFGGLAAGLEMLLRSNIPVTRYIYSDTSPQARAVAAHRLPLLTRQYGSTLLPPSAYERAFSTLPQDVYAITTGDLVQAGARDGTQWMVVAGWECQDLSPAGSGRGLQGRRSSSFFPLLSIVGALQQLQASRPPAYLLENTAMQCSPNFSERLQQDFSTICDRIGRCVLLDAAQVNSHAHRLRDYWTNLADATDIQASLASCVRDPATCVQQILEPGRAPQLARFTHPSPPYWPANLRGQPVVVLPTLMATPNSYSFRDGKQGMVVHTASRSLVSLTISERERALGYSSGCTAAPGLSAADRLRITGNCMDANALHSICSTALALRATPAPRPSTQLPYHPAFSSTSGGGGTPASLPGALAPEVHPAVLYVSNLTAAAKAEVQDAALSQSTDIWDDKLCLEYLRHGEYSLPAMQETTAANRLRAIRRSRSYTFQATKLYRRMANQELKEVLPPPARAAAVKAAHERSGHFGRKRTTHILLLTYWWAGIYQDVKTCITNCQPCAQVKAAGFNSMRPELNSLPVMGMFYRWHVDLCGPFPASERGHKYVMVCVEAFSKHAEFIPIKDKTAAEVAYAFLHNVLARFGACAEVVTDQGTEFQGAFHDLLSDCFIDQRTTSSHHPQANGLAERCVQTLKQCLKKHSETDAPIEPWDKLVAWIALSYRCAPQASTGVAPYHMLYAQPPIIPPAIRPKLTEPLDFSTPEQAGLMLLERAAAVKHACIIAGQNLLIAKHRDTLRYAKLRSGAYLPKILRFEVGDYVYVRRNTADGKPPTSLHALARPEILRIIEVRESGVLNLQGRDGLTIQENPVNCTPCHLPIVDEQLEPNNRPALDQPCQVCGYPDHEEVMILCDSCDSGWHTYCLTPPLAAVPTGTWICPTCINLGVNPTTLKTGRATTTLSATRRANLKKAPAERPSAPSPQAVMKPTPAEPATEPTSLPANTPHSPATPLTDHQESQQYDQREVLRQHTLATGIRAPARGIATYLGPNAFPPFRVTYADNRQERLTLRAVRNSITPLDAAHTAQPPLPTGPSPTLRRSTRPTRTATALSSSATNTDPLPLDLCLTTTDGVLQALHFLMPGPWSTGHATVLSHVVPGGQRFLQTQGSYHPGQPQRVATLEPEIDELLNVIDFTHAPAIFDPFSGDNNIKKAFNQAGLDVTTNDFNFQLPTDYHLDALQPRTYEELRTDQPLHTVVMSPFFAVLDLALPLAVLYAEQLVCCHVPGHYLTNAPPARLSWLIQLQDAGRLMLVMGLPRGPTGRRCMWLIIFADPLLRDLLVRPHARNNMGVHIVAPH